MAREEVYNQGRTAGVEGTYGSKRKGVAEKTVLAHSEGVGGGEGELPGAARGMYQKAVSNGGGKDTGGDPAVRRR